MKKSKAGTEPNRPFLTGDPSIDYRVPWHKYYFTRTPEEQRSAEAFRASYSGYRNYDKVWPRSSARYEDEVRYEKKYGKYSDQDPADFAAYVNRYRKEHGVPELRKDREGFHAAMARLYPGRVLPVIIR